MEDVRHDLDRYGVRTRLEGYVCPECEQVYPSLYWFRHSPVLHRMLCESCVPKSPLPATYLNVLEVVKAGDLELAMNTNLALEMEDLASKPWWQYAQDAAIVLVTVIVVAQIERATGSSLHELIPGLSAFGDVIEILFGWLVSIAVVAGVVWWWRRRSRGAEDHQTRGGS